MRKTKQAIALVFASMVSVLLGGVLTINADAATTVDESKFVMYHGASVRTEGTSEHPNATGLRFKTYASEFKDQLNAVYPVQAYDYRWYTELRFKMWDGVSMNGDLKQYTTYESQVSASVWNDDGWNTVLLNIPNDAVAIDITAQSFVEITNENGGTVYEMNTKSVTYSAAQTASWALALHSYQTETQRTFLLNYVDAAQVDEIRLPRTYMSVEVGKSDDICANSYPLGYGITYTSDNTSVATVDGNGRITGVAEGTANITLSIGSTLSKVCQVNVRKSGDVPTSITSWTNTSISWNYFNQSSKMYPFYKYESDDGTNKSGTGKVVQNRIQISGAPTTTYYTLNSEYLNHTFGLSYVKAVRIKLTGLTGYEINQFKLNYDGLTDDYIRYYKDGDAIWLQFNRSAYEAWLKTRESEDTQFVFRFQLREEGGEIYGGEAIANPPTFYVEEISPVFDGVTEDFEYGTSAYITTDAQSRVERITERTNGRGMYALNVVPADKTLTVHIASAYVNKVFASGAAVLQFRVYTDQDLTSLTVNGSTANVQYKYNADGRYYVVRIANTYNNSTLKVVLTGESALGEVYLDAFTGTNETIGENITKTAAHARDEGGEPTFDAAKTFNFYAYSSLSVGQLNGCDYDFDEPTLETLLELKEVGMDAIMPQSLAVVGENGAKSGNFDYRTLLDLAEQAGLKVLLADHILWHMSGGKEYQYAIWQSYYDGARETEGEWKGAAAKGTPMYEKVKAQLSYCINHPAYMGVVLWDEPSVWLFDDNLPSGDATRKSGAFALTYKTVKRVAQEEFGKDIFIQANLLPTAAYGAFKTHSIAQNYPELTVKRYGEITGMDVSAYADANGSTDYIAAAGAQFYTDLEKHVEYIGASSPGNQALVERDMQYAIMRERYGRYCELFLQATNADCLMADMYPIYGETPKERYLLEVQTAAEVAAAYGAELHIVSQTMTHLDGDNANGERLLAEADLCWMNNVLLAYGVKNISFFTYHVRATQHYDTSFVDETGEKTAIWYAMQNILSQNKAFASTYHSFDLQSSKTYYDPLAVFNGEFGRYANDLNYCDGNLYLNDAVSFTALTNVSGQGELTMISEFKNANDGYMYAIMNVTDGKYRTDVGAYEQVKLTFDDQYTHVILWRNGVKTLVALDENNALEIENAAGEIAFVIPYCYKSTGYYEKETGDNGAFFPINGQW